MPPTLPSRIGSKLGIVAALLVVLGMLLSCKHVVSEKPVKPGPPIPAEPEEELENMDTECAGLIAALDNYGKCPNLEDGDREWAQRTIEYAEDSFAAGKKANPDEPSQKAIAAACHRAALSIQFATQRCHAGKRPKVDD
jgi:hypothetical protein